MSLLVTRRTYPNYSLAYHNRSIIFHYLSIPPFDQSQTPTRFSHGRYQHNKSTPSHPGRQRSASDRKLHEHSIEAAVNAIAQQRTVTGVVGDGSENLIGVSILLKGTGTGTSTDVNGAYSITVPDENAVLVFSYTGYASQEIQVGTQTKIDVILGGVSDIGETLDVAKQNPKVVERLNALLDACRADLDDPKNVRAVGYNPNPVHLLPPVE